MTASQNGNSSGNNHHHNDNGVFESNDGNGANDNNNNNNNNKNEGKWMFRLTILLFVLDMIVSILFMSPLIPRIYQHEGQHKHYTFSSSLFDLLVLAVCRTTVASMAFCTSFLKGEVRNEYPFDMQHRNGTKKTKEELEEEALEQSFGTWLTNSIHRAAFPSELFALITTLLCVTKCLVRLNVEIGILKDAEPIHPIFWCAVLFAAVVSVFEMTLVDPVCVLLGKWGHVDREQGSRSLLRQISSQLSLPLLANDSLEDTDNEANSNEVEGGTIPEDDENVAGTSDIGGDTDYKASWTDLLQLCAPDAFLIFIAFIFLILAAAAQIYIPRYTGAILDALEEAYSTHDDDDESIQDVPGFMSNVRKLIIVSLLGGIFSGIRGSIFTVCGGRVNVRIR
jgi:hypothetical protein